VVLKLSGEGVTVTDVPLSDLGAAPDFRAGDGVYFAELPLDPDRVTVRLEVDGVLTNEETVVWEPAAAKRAIDVRWVEGAITAVGVDGPPPPLATDTTAIPAPRATPAAADARDAGAPATAPTGSRVVLYAAIGVGQAALAGLGLVLSGARLGGRGLPRGLTRIPMLGVFGPGTPSLDAPLQTWGVEASQRAALVARLLRAIAPHHPVVLVGDVGTVDAAPGARVFRGDGGPAAILRAARGLASPTEPVVLVVVPQPGEAGGAWAAAGADCRVVVIEADRVDGCDAVFARGRDGWRCRHAGGEVVLPEPTEA
jgi:hypothetical protein